MSQNYSGRNLQGCSFKGQELSDANFSNCDIRGVDFSNAILIRANFSNARSGVPDSSTTGVVVISLILATIAGLITSVIASSTYSIIFRFGELTNTFFVFVMLAIFAVVTICIIRQNLNVAITALIAALPVTLLVTFVMSLAGGLSGFVPGNSTTTIATAFVGGVAGAIAAIAILTGAIFLATSITVAGAACITGAVGVAIAGVASILIGVVGSVAMGMAISGNSLFSIDGLIAVNNIMADVVLKNASPTETWVKIFDLAGAGVKTAIIASMIMIAFPISVLGSYIAWRTLAGDEKYALIRQIAVTWTTAVGTNFRDANLSDANFTQANLKSTNLSTANLTCTCWLHAKKLDWAKLDGSYLENSKIRKLAITKQGANQNFENQNLQGINLQGANLENARLIGANLCQANLQAANLSGAILVRSQLELANLSNACLTGACIENWGVSKTTKLHNIICEYVYLNFISEDKRNRMPSEGNFKAGEFTQFVESILTSFDLAHNLNINPKAAIKALQILSDEYQEPIEIVGLENRDNQIIFKMKNSNPAKAEQIQQEYQSRYNQTISLSLLDNASELPAYQVLERQLTQLIEEVKQPRATYIKYLHNSGMVITGGNVKANVERDRAFPKDLLSQLQATIQTIPNWNLAEKAEAINQVKLIEAAGENTHAAARKQARTAIRVLRGIILALPKTSSLVREVERLLDAIAQSFSSY